MNKRLTLIHLIFILLTFVSPLLLGESLFLYVDERTNGKQGPFPPPVKEGIYNGLFENDFIVFDSGDKQLFDVNWENRVFIPLVNIAREGGADFIVALKVNAKEKKKDDEKKSIEIVANYYIVSSTDGKVIGSGRIKDSNDKKDDKRNHELVGFDVGMKISDSVAKLINEYLDNL